MTINTDAKYNGLGRFGYSGAQEDRELQFYKANGATSDNVRDAEVQFLTLRGFTKGSVDDRWNAYLKSLGYTGGNDDMLPRWWGEMPGSSAYLDFLKSSPFISVSGLDPRITFSRASNATVTGPDGTLQYAPHNLLTYSEQFDNAVWTKTASTITANATTAPDGASTADKLVANTTSTTHFVQQAQTQQSAVAFSVYLKAAEYLFARLVVASTANATVSFNLSTGEIIASSGAGLIGTPTITDDGNGWYRCCIFANPSSGNANAVVHVSDDGSSNPFVGDGTSGIFIWGAQLNVGALQPYYPTTVKNLLGFTQEFDNAAWTLVNATITANNASSPDGSQTAETLAVSAGGYIRRDVAGFGTGVGTVSYYVRKPATGGANAVRLTTNNTTAWDTGLSTKLTLTSSWQRISLTGNLISSGTAVRVILGAVNASGTNDADCVGNVEIWGAQLSDSASLDPYVYNPGAAPAAAAYYGPRFDYDPVTLAPKGLLIEEQRTNSIRNNTMQGAVAGTPGTTPTNWVQNVIAGGLNRTIVGTGVTNGITWIDIQFQGTTTNTNGYGLIFESSTGVAATSGQTWTGSSFFSVVAGSAANITNINSRITERDAGGAALVVSDTPITVGSSLSRFTQTRTLTNASTAFVASGFSFTIPSGVPINITLRIGMPQLELGAFATSVIPTTTAAATRAADVAVMTGANFSNWYNQSEGTVFADVGSVGNANGLRALTLSDGTLDNQAWVRSAVPPTNAAEVYTAGSFVAQIGVNTGAAAKTALALKANDFAVSVNGGAAATDTSGALGTYNRLTIGSNFNSSGVFLNGHIRRVAYFPRRLSNAELQAITS